MYMRFLRVNLGKDIAEILFEVFSVKILPSLQNVDGCLFAGILQNEKNEDEGISLTLWDTEESAKNYELNGDFSRIINDTAVYFKDIERLNKLLDEGMSLFEIMRDNFLISRFNVISSAGSELPSSKGSENAYVRIASSKIKEELWDEAIQIYKSDILPALLEVNGIEYIFFLEDCAQDRILHSLTIWRSQDQAQQYLYDGSFESLYKNIEHTFEQSDDIDGQMPGHSLDTKADEKLFSSSYYLKVGHSML